MADAENMQRDGMAEQPSAGSPAKVGSVDVASSAADASGATATADAANAADAAVSPDALQPPAPPSFARDYRELAQEAANVRARQAARAHAARRRRIAALGIAVAGVALVVVGAAATLLLSHVSFDEPDAADGATSTAPGASSDDSSAQMPFESGDGSEASEGSVSAVEAVVAADQISAAFSSLASDEDGVFTGFVAAFMEDYDQGVNTEVSYTLSDLGIQSEELAPLLLSGFSCTAASVDVQGQTAWVNVEVTSKSFADQANAFAQAVESGAAAVQDEESYKAFLKQAYLEAFDGVSPRSHSLLVTVARTDDGWTVTDDTMEYILGSVWYTSA